MTTLCEIRGPLCVAVAANQTVLVSTSAHTLCKVTHEGTTHQTHPQHHNKEIYADAGIRITKVQSGGGCGIRESCKGGWTT